MSTLEWRHNERDGVSNHQPRECLLNRLFRRRSKQTSKLRVTGLCAGNSPVSGDFPAQRASNAENVSIWWRHHESREMFALSLVIDVASYECLFLCECLMGMFIITWAAWLLKSPKHYCLFSSRLTLTTKIISGLHITGPLRGQPHVTNGFAAQSASNAESGSHCRTG